MTELRPEFPPESEWPALLGRYDRPLPRYTSYPPVPAWHGDPLEARARIDAAAEKSDRIALYVHVPFCPSLCWYCACNRHITKDPALAERYLDAVEQELDAVAARIGRARVRWLHWGGGTPNSLTFAQIARLFRAVMARFSLAGDAEVSAEIDPRLATRGQIALFATLGFNRLSLGVQDFQEATQAAIHRYQSVAQTRSVVDWAREFEIAGINVDLIYGLPLQTRDSFALTVEQVLALRPDRVAAYAYAHVPWVNHAQRAYEQQLPERPEKFGMIVDAVGEFEAAGYRHVGIDHFAAPGDALAAATTDGTISRTFMGYSPRRADTLVAIGASAISASRDAFAQNHHDVPGYLDGVASGTLVERGCVLNADDLSRQAVIEGIMTAARVSAEDAVTFAVDASGLTALERDGMLVRQADSLVLTPLGRLFARNVAACFDAYRSESHSRHASAV